MNKCILCTFFTMIWNGLWHNTCPSIDKKKIEKKAPTSKVLGESVMAFVVAVLFGILIVGVVKIVLFIFPWLLGVLAFLCQWIFILILIPVMAIGFIYGAACFTKERIDCIRAYWRKAKEACE